LALSPDGKTLVSGDWGNRITIWNLATGQKRTTLTGHYGTVEALTISHDGKLLASGSPKQVKVWNLATGALVQNFGGFYIDPILIAFSPDEKSLIVGGGRNPYRIWNLATGKTEATLTKDSNWSGAVVFSPDGKTMLSGTEEGIAVWKFAAPSH
jgi:WD40 repeat protein